MELKNNRNASMQRLPNLFIKKKANILQNPALRRMTPNRFSFHADPRKMLNATADYDEPIKKVNANQSFDTDSKEQLTDLVVTDLFKENKLLQHKLHQLFRAYETTILSYKTPNNKQKSAKEQNGNLAGLVSSLEYDIKQKRIYRIKGENRHR